MTRRTIRNATAASAIALATALCAAPAAAQSFEGSANVTFGAATVTQGTGTTDVTVSSPSAVIDWTPNDNAIANGQTILFQPANTTAMFSGASDFAVLNRIVPADLTRAIVFDGTVLSRVGQAPGGTVFFYSPGGILVSSNAVFDVGNLGLTTAAPAVDGNGNWYANNTVQFGQAISGTQIDIQPGAQITASSAGSYVAAFAPVVRQRGTVDVNGQAAYVAGEAGTITFSPDGLFDIQVTVGTDGDSFGTAIQHDGTTTGPANAGGAVNRVYMVAVPKNQAISIALGQTSSVGFDVAGAADVIGNAVVLSAGHNIVSGGIDQNAVPAGNRAQITMTGGNATSDFLAVATGSARFSGQAAPSDFASNATFVGEAPAGSPTITAQFSAFGPVTVGGDLRVIAGWLPGAPGAAVSTQEARLEVINGGSIQVAGDIAVDASAFGFDAQSPGVSGGAGNGGTAGIVISGGGTISANEISVEANGRGGSAFAGIGNGGAGQGGFAFVNTLGGAGTITTSQLQISADGSGGDAAGTSGTGGVASGGTAQLRATSDLTINGPVDVSADASAGASNSAGAGGLATGGFAVIQSAGGALTIGGVADVDVDANGGSSQGGNGGNANMGFAVVEAFNGGSIQFNSDLFIEATAEGGFGVNGGNALGSIDSVSQVNAFLQAIDGSVSVAGTTDLLVESTGGDAIFGGNGGSADGGAAVIISKTVGPDPAGLPGNGSLVTLADVLVTNIATGGAGGDVASGTGGAGGSATAGQVELFGDSGNGQLVVTGATQAIANAIGGAGGTGNIGGAGGDAIGGAVTVGTRSGPVTPDNTGSATFTTVDTSASGFGGFGGAGRTGAGGAGGDGTNGSAAILVRGSQVTITGTSDMAVLGVGGDGGAGATVAGIGGDGIAGGSGGVGVIAGSRFQVPTDRGMLDAGPIVGLATAAGGQGSTNGAALVQDGPLFFQFIGADATIASVDLVVDGGGSPVVSGAPSLITVNGGTVDVGAFSMTTPGPVQISIDSGALNTGTFDVLASAVVLPPAPPALAGTITASQSASIIVDPTGVLQTYANITAPQIFLQAGPALQTGNLTSSGDIELLAQGPVVTGALSAGGFIEVGSDTSVMVGNGTAGEYIDLYATGPITAGDLTAGDSVTASSAGGDVIVGNLSAGLVNPSSDPFAEYSVGLASQTGNVSAGNISAAAQIGVLAAGAATLGNLSATDVLLLPGANLTTGSITASSRLFIGDDSMAALGGPLDTFDPEPIFAAQPVATGGSVAIGGPVTADTFVAASGGQFSAGAVAVQSFLQVASNGLISVGGAWTGPNLFLTSNDISIGSAGSLSAPNGEVGLLSTNANGSFIGAGTPQSGQYVLDNAEFGRITAGIISIGQLDGLADIDMTIGDLTVTASQLPDSFGEGTLDFYVDDDPQRSGESGGIRINGNVAATGFTDDMQLDFNAYLIELNAATGSIKVGGTTPGSLGGQIEFEGTRLHVASDDILLKLRADPLYAGHVQDLNAPATVQRPEGVLNARALLLYPNETLYIQNTGTAANPAGFYTTVENSDIDPPGFSDPAASDVEVVINGRFATAAGDVSGRPAYQLVIDNAESLDGFSLASAINGCTLSSGACPSSGQGAPPASSDEISVLTEDVAEEEPFDTSEEEQEQAEEDARAPISPPVVLINTRPLNPDVDVTDPVSGTGNPALIGASVKATVEGAKK